MTAARHISEALRETNQLVADMGVMGCDLSHGQRVTSEQVEHIQRVARFVAYKLALANGDLQRIPQVDQLPHGQTIELPGRPQFVERRGANAEPAMVGRRIDDPPIVLELRDVKGVA